MPGTHVMFLEGLPAVCHNGKRHEAANNLPDANRDTLLCVQVEVAGVVEHISRSAEIHQ